MKTYWLTLAITEKDLAEVMDVEVKDIENGDYIGWIRDFGEVVKLEEVVENDK